MTLAEPYNRADPFGDLEPEPVSKLEPEPVSNLEPDDDLVDEQDDEPGRLRVTLGSSVKPIRVRWAFDQLIPLAAVTLLAGREGLGKSTVWAHHAALATRGELPTDDLDGPRHVIVVANEDSIEHTIVPRLVAAGADLDRVAFVDVETPTGSRSVTLPLDGTQLVRLARKLDAALVIVDPLVSALDGRLDSHKDHSIRQALDPLNRVAATSGAAVVGLVHINKGQGTDVLDRVLGSRAFTAAARSVLALIDDDADDGGTRRLLVHAKSNLGPMRRDAIVYAIESATVTTGDDSFEVGAARVVGTREVHLDDVMSHRDEDAAADLNAAGRWLLDYLASQGGEAEHSAIVAAGKAAGHSRDQLKRARRKAGVTYSHTGVFPTNTVWTHPANTAPHSGQSGHSGETRETPGPTVETHSGHPSHVSRLSGPCSPSGQCGPTARPTPTAERNSE